MIKACALLGVNLTTTFIGRGEQEIAKKLRQLKCPVFLIVNKTDTVKKEAVAEVKAAEQPKKEEKKPVAAAKAPEKKPANKPVVNRTVRVDIEKLEGGQRKVTDIVELVDYSDGKFVLNPLMQLDKQQSLTPTGRALMQTRKMNLKGASDVQGLCACSADV